MNLIQRAHGDDIDLTPPFARLSMNDAVKKYANADFLGCATDEEARELAKKIKLPFDDKTATKGKLLALAFDEFVEDKLIQPTFIIDYPVENSPLSKRNALSGSLPATNTQTPSAS